MDSDGDSASSGGSEDLEIEDMLNVRDGSDDSGSDSGSGSGSGSASDSDSESSGSDEDLGLLDNHMFTNDKMIQYTPANDNIDIDEAAEDALDDKLENERE